MIYGVFRWFLIDKIQAVLICPQGFTVTYFLVCAAVIAHSIVRLVVRLCNKTKSRLFYDFP